MSESSKELFPGFISPLREACSEKKEPGKPRLKRIERDQLVLRPTNVEELVGADHDVRAIWELTGHLDLSGFYEGIEAVEGVAGREPFDPRLLVSLWLYATKDGVSSARELSRLCEQEPAYEWLSALQPINHHTLSDFRVNHREALDQLFVEMLGVLSAEGLVSLERVMHDGTKVKACAGQGSFKREEKLREHLALAREQVAAMGDPRTAQEVSPRVAAARARAAQEKAQRLEEALAELKKIQATKQGEAKEGARASENDPQARIMKQGNGGYAPSYNVQISTDAQAGAIVGVGTSQAENDTGELKPAVDRIEQNLGQKPVQMVADGGYTTRANIVAMAQDQIDFIGSWQDPRVAQDRRGIDRAFGPEVFVYDATRNQYHCPAGKDLLIHEKRECSGRLEFRYRARARDCRRCPFKAKCCPASQSREVIRAVEPEAVIAFRQKMERDEAKAIYKQRAGIAEFPNAWIKEKFGLRQFRCRGLLKTSMEAQWACLTYNIQLWIRLRWRPRWQAVPT